MKKYKIGEVGKEFGVSLDALRFYEKKGFLKPQKDQESGFRYYTYDDFGTFLAIKTFRQMGFQVKDIGSIFNGFDLNGIISTCNNKIAQKKEEIKNLEKEVRKISEYVQLLQEYKSDDKRWIIETAETYYLLKHVQMDNGTLCENPLFKIWLNYSPSVYSAIYIPKNQIQFQDFKGCYWVMAIAESKIREYQAPVDDSVIKLTMGKCFKYFYSKDVNETMSMKKIEELIAVIHSLGYTQNGDILCRYVCETKQQEKTFENYVIIIPIIISNDAIVTNI
ncbi:MerR family transcriptional regulator [Neobacillus sp. LXY-1]|uniref:MerR family transcriptional regulator n=1 Tax=Neobacillus sp. LXY-1 TaxID=3379133 RepID=UPI003EDF89F1